MNSNHRISVAYFVSPHGYGHAARAAAVMQALQDIEPRICFEIFTTVPAWFFENSFIRPFRYHAFLTDVGFVQNGPFEIDLERTVKRLDEFMPLDPVRYTDLITTVRETDCRLVICDISPLGIMAARELGIPSVLLENFTWNWLYEPYSDQVEGLDRHIRDLKSIFSCADYLIQAEPVCAPRPHGLTVPPISRKRMESRSNIRKKLEIPEGVRLITLTMGGIPGGHCFLDGLPHQEGIRFLIPGRGEKKKLYHPDLIHASDMVIGKVGYSTLAEVYSAGVPFGYITRRGFRESPVLASFIRENMAGLCISEESPCPGNWSARISKLLGLPRVRKGRTGGAERAARFILGIL